MPNYELHLTIFVKQVFQREQMFRSESTTYLVYKIQKQNKVYGFSVSIFPCRVSVNFFNETLILY